MSVVPSVDALIVLVGLMSAVWVASLFLQDVSIVDVAWGATFVVAAWIYWAEAELIATRQIVVLTLVHVWGIRLAAYLGWRSWGRPEDRRYRAMRERAGSRFAWTSLFNVFWLQAVLAWVISAPLYAALRAASPHELTILDWLGMALFGVGFGFEAVGDWQLARFKGDPRSHGQVCDIGLWRYTRHPNYFGEAVVWWGFGCLAASTPSGGWSLVGPTLITVLLLRVSGVTLLERDLVQSKPGYRDYLARTSGFVPWVPRAPAPDRQGDRIR